jgi:hypothetical protein
MANQKLSATIFFQINSTLKPRKYRNISNKNSFIKFAESEGAWYINFYSQKTKEYLCRCYLKDYKK